jgi:hypothetical protein
MTCWPCALDQNHRTSHKRSKQWSKWVIMRGQNPKREGSNIENTVYLQLPPEQVTRQPAKARLVGVAHRTHSSDYMPCECHIKCVGSYWCMPLLRKLYKTSPPLNVIIILDTVNHAGFFFKHKIPETRSGVKRWKLPHLKSISRLLEQCLTLPTSHSSNRE